MTNFNQGFQFGLGGYTPSANYGVSTFGGMGNTLGNSIDQYMAQGINSSYLPESYMQNNQFALANNNAGLSNVNAGGFGQSFKDFNSNYGSAISTGIQTATGLWNAFNGMQQTKLAKEQMANSLAQWNKNYANQVSSYNTRLEDRQNARVAAQGANQQDTASYMEKNRLK